MTRLAGPLGAFISYRPGRTDDEPGTLLVRAAAREPVPAAHTSGVNGALLLRRATWVIEPGDRQREAAAAALRETTAAALDPSRNGRLLRAAASRRAAAVAKLAARGRVVRTLRVTPVWRLVVGLGEPTPGETGLSLHSTYGVPIVPGAALKGLARGCAREWFPDDYADYGAAAFGAEPGDNDQPEPAPRDASAEGGPAQQRGEPAGGSSEPERPKDGRVMFLDALPEPLPGAGPGVSVDVMNPHTPGYYTDGGASPPAEHAQPVPVVFYTVTPAVVFTLHLVGRGHDPDLPELALADNEALPAWLTKGLTEAGLGAKTNSGYGYLTVEIVDSGGAGQSSAGSRR
jgi:CRISPR-associated protein Cmr6